MPDAHIAPEFPTEAEASPIVTPASADLVAEAGVGDAVAEPSAPVIARPARSQRGQPSATRAGPRRRKERFLLVTFVSTFRSMIFTFSAAVIVATIFMWWTPNDFLPSRVRGQLAPVGETAQPASSTFTPVPTSERVKRIGIIAGHMGNENIPGVPDPGAVCEDGSGFTEVQATIPVAKRVVALLQGLGFEVDLLNEYDPRLKNYQADALLSLHADSCSFEFGSGFKNAYPLLRESIREKDIFFSECIRTNYEALTRLDFLPNQITPNMTEYHAWNRIALTTPANILELGLLAQDRALLRDQQDLLAQAIVNGMLCFLAPKSLATQQAATTAPTAPPVVITPGPVPTITLQPVS